MSSKSGEWTDEVRLLVEWLVDLPEKERALILDDECPDPEIRMVVEALLRP